MIFNILSSIGLGWVRLGWVGVYWGYFCKFAGDTLKGILQLKNNIALKCPEYPSEYFKHVLRSM